MFNLGPLEVLAILVVALLVFGPEKLPEMGKQVGRAVREFRKFQESMQSQVRDVIEPIAGPIIPNGGIVGPEATNIRGSNIPRSATIQNPDPPNGEAATPPGTFGHYAPVEPPATPAESAPAVPAESAPAAPAVPAESAPAVPAESAGPAPRPATPADGPAQATGWARPADPPSPPASPAEPDAG